MTPRVVAGLLEAVYEHAPHAPRGAFRGERGRNQAATLAGMSEAPIPVLRGGVVGLGVMGTHHTRVLRTLDGVELRGVVDPERARRGRAPRRPRR